MLAGRRADCVAVGQRAVAMARDVGDAAVLSHALDNVGTALWDDGMPEGQAMLEESLAVALEAGEVEHACRAYVNIVWHLMDVLRFAEADRILDDAIELADEAEFDGFRRYLQLTRSMVYLALGRWDEAEREIPWAVDAEPIIRCPALVVLGTVRARRGQDGAATAGAGLGDRPATRRGAAHRTCRQRHCSRQHGCAATLPVSLPSWRRHTKTCAASVACRRQPSSGTGCAPRTGPCRSTTPSIPYTLLAHGQWREAAEAWGRAGCPYEQALARAQSPDPADLLAALAALDALGAEPLARKVRLRLRELGVSRIPRGRVQATRDNPAGLTERQTDVIRLLSEGLTNAEIAARLVLSVRTVDTHVGAILNKLDAKTRRDAAARAKALGLLDAQAGRPPTPPGPAGPTHGSVSRAANLGAERPAATGDALHGGSALPR